MRRRARASAWRTQCRGRHPDHAAPDVYHDYNSVGAIDYNISATDQLRGRWIYNRTSTIDNYAALPSFYQPWPILAHTLTVTENHMFNPRLSNEFRLGYNRYVSDSPAGDFKFTGLDMFPNLTFDELGLQVGPDPNAPQFTFTNTYQISDNLSWTKGDHNFKFGADLRKLIAPQWFIQRSRGDYEYEALESYLLDITPDVLAQRNLGSAPWYGDQVGVSWYVNDSWRVRPNLTLNFGLRHEYTTIPYSTRLQRLNEASSIPGLITFGEPRAPKKNFMPRIGVAYSPGTSGNTSLRAGFGMNYDVLFDNLGILATPPQLTYTVDVTGRGSSNFLSNGGITGATGVTTPTVAEQKLNTSSYVPVNQKDPYSIDWNLGVQHVFANVWTAEARYVGTRGVHLPMQNRFTLTTPVTASHSLPTYLAAPSQAALDALPVTLDDLLADTQYACAPPTYVCSAGILPQYADGGLLSPALVGFMPWGSSSYHGLALSLNRRMTDRLQLITSYTWSHAIDNSTAVVASTYLTPRRSQDFQDLAAERGTSMLDRRQRLTITALWEPKYLKNADPIVRHLSGRLDVHAFLHV